MLITIKFASAYPNDCFCRSLNAKHLWYRVDVVGANAFHVDYIIILEHLFEVDTFRLEHFAATRSGVLTIKKQSKKQSVKNSSKVKVNTIGNLHLQFVFIELTLISLHTGFS